MTKQRATKKAVRAKAQAQGRKYTEVRRTQSTSAPDLTDNPMLQSDSPEDSRSDPDREASGTGGGSGGTIENSWPADPAVPPPEVVWAEANGSGEMVFALSGGGCGNPGCDECGTADAVARVERAYLCESALHTGPWPALLECWRQAHADECCEECGAVCGGYDGLSYAHERSCSLHPENTAG